MKTVTRQYIREVKTLFPSRGKQEREYIKKLAITIDEFCEEEQVETKQSVYEKYGKPIDIVHDYYSALDTVAIVKRIRLTSTIKFGMVSLIGIALIAAIIYSFSRYAIYMTYVRAVSIEREPNGDYIVEDPPIVTGRWDDDGNPLPLDNEPVTFPTEETDETGEEG